MGWDITAEIEYKTLDRFLESALGFFAADIERVTLDISAEEESARQPLVQYEILPEQEIHEVLQASLAEHYLKNAAIANILILVYLKVKREHDENLPTLTIYIPRVQPVLRCQLKFYNCDNFRGEKILAVSRKLLNPDLVLRFVQYLCLETEPIALYIADEELDPVHWNHHLVFHRFCRYYLEDAKAMLDAGSRSNVNSPKSSDASIQRFGDRSAPEISSLIDFIESSKQQFKRRRLPDSLTFDEFNNVLTQTLEQLQDDAQFEYFCTTQGIGIYGLLFLEGNCEMPYRALIRHLAGNPENLHLLPTQGEAEVADIEPEIPVLKETTTPTAPSSPSPRTNAVDVPAPLPTAPPPSPKPEPESEIEVAVPAVTAAAAPQPARDPLTPLVVDPRRRVEALLKQLGGEHQLLTKFNLQAGAQVMINPIKNQYGQVKGMMLEYGSEAVEADLVEQLGRLVAYHDLMALRRSLRDSQLHLQNWLKQHGVPSAGSVANILQEQVNQLAEQLKQQQQGWEQDRLLSMPAGELQVAINRASPQVEHLLRLSLRLERNPNFGFLDAAVLEHELSFRGENLGALYEFLADPTVCADPRVRAVFPAIGVESPAEPPSRTRPEFEADFDVEFADDPELELTAPLDLVAVVEQFFEHYFLATDEPGSPLQICSLHPAQSLQLQLDTEAYPWQLSRRVFTPYPWLTLFSASPTGTNSETDETLQTFSETLLNHQARFSMVRGVLNIRRLDPPSPQVEKAYYRLTGECGVQRQPFGELSPTQLALQVAECMLTMKLYPNRTMILSHRQEAPLISLALRWGGVEPGTEPYELLDQVWQIKGSRAVDPVTWLVVKAAPFTQALQVGLDAEAQSLQEGSRAYFEKVLTVMGSAADNQSQTVAAELASAWVEGRLRYLYFRVHFRADTQTLLGVEQWEFDLRAV